MSKLSKYFQEAEFYCKCCGKLPPNGMDPRLISSLTALRDQAKYPIRIISGYRCPEYNDRCGGSPRSQHMLGRAADIRLLGFSFGGIFQLKHLITSNALTYFAFVRGGIGVYRKQNFLHVDVRGEHGGRPARWNDG